MRFEFREKRVSSKACRHWPKWSEVRLVNARAVQQDFNVMSNVGFMNLRVRLALVFNQPTRRAIRRCHQSNLFACRFDANMPQTSERYAAAANETVPGNARPANFNQQLPYAIFKFQKLAHHRRIRDGELIIVVALYLERGSGTIHFAGH